MPSFAFYVQEYKNQSKDTWTTNSLRFATDEEAKAYGSDLLSRWFAVVGGEARETPDPVNYAWVTGKGLERLVEEVEEVETAPDTPAPLTVAHYQVGPGESVTITKDSAGDYVLTSSIKRKSANTQFKVALDTLESCALSMAHIGDAPMPVSVFEHVLDKINQV